MPRSSQAGNSPSAQPQNTARIIWVLVSSPSDADRERRALQEVAENINRTDGRAGGFRLELFLWEKDAPRRLGPAPQEGIDEAIPATYEVYIGIMKSRFGTPTGAYGSGTEKEFRDAYQRYRSTGAPEVIFFFDDEVTAGRDRESIAQWSQLCEFREELQKLGLVHAYTGVKRKDTGFFLKADFELREAARRILHGAERRETLPAKPTIPEPYRNWLRGQCRDIELMGLKLKQGQVTRLASVYVPLTTSAQSQPSEDARSPTREATAEREKPPPLLLDEFGKESLYVSGSPGAGKSVFCRWLSLVLCENAVPTHAVDPPKEFRERFDESFRDRLPMLVRLRDFWQSLPLLAGKRELTHRELEAALADWLTSKSCGLDWAAAGAHLANGSAVLIFDGMDEVPRSHGDPLAPCSPREMLLTGLADAIAAWHAAGNRVLVTGRPYGLSDAEVNRLGLRQAPISDLPKPLQELLVKRWFTMLLGGDGGDPQDAAATAAKMFGDLSSRQDLRELSANPMLLTAMCVIYTEGKRLPQDKHNLYDRIVENVLYNRFVHDPTVIDPVRRRLEVIAHGMHTGDALGQERATPQAAATYDEIDALLAAYDNEDAFAGDGFQTVVETRELLVNRSGLLLPREERRAGYYHLSIQEFLAAMRLWMLEGGGGVERLAQTFAFRARVPEWHNTLCFFFARCWTTA